MHGIANFYTKLEPNKVIDKHMLSVRACDGYARLYIYIIATSDCNPVVGLQRTDCNPVLGLHMYMEHVLYTEPIGLYTHPITP
jgi:hypothetical protein